MKNLILLLILIALPFMSFSQVEIQPNAIGIKSSQPISELSINSVGEQINTVHIEADEDNPGSTALYAEAFDVTGGGGTFTYGIRGSASQLVNASRALGVTGVATRATPSSNGRSTGVRGIAGDSTPGANYGVYGSLIGSNQGTAILGHDDITYDSWSQVLPNNVFYAGYFRGKGYFHDNVGIGQENPVEKLQINNGNIYIETPNDGIIFNTSSGCFKLTVDGSTGQLVLTPITCP